MDYSKIKTRLSLNELSALSSLQQNPAGLTRAALCMATGLTDRSLRQIVRNLREKGVPVVSRSSKTGYHLAITDEDVRLYVANEMSAAKSRMKTAKLVQKAFRLRDQMTLRRAA